MSLNPPRRLGKYELQQRLGRGGMAEVWKAFDTQLQRSVAIKLLHANLQADPNFISRFQHEAQVIASLHHQNIVQIHDFQVSEPPESETPTFYMVMAYIEGQTLADYIAGTSARGHIPAPGELVNLFASISLAVDYAHQQGMIHRDIKPANILLDGHNRARNPMGEPILTDFGLAKLLGVSATALSGSLSGTPLYTSPEQIRGYPGNERSDLYALGVILYEIVTGTPPFRGETPQAVLAQHLNDTPMPPVLLNPNIPPALTMVMMTALAKDPNARFTRAVIMAAAIAEALALPLPESLGQVAYPPALESMPTHIGMPFVQPGTGGSSTPPLTSLSPVSPLAVSSAGPTLAASAPPGRVTEAARVSSPAGVAQRTLAATTPAIAPGPFAPPAAPTPRRWKGWYTVLVALLLLLMLGSGLGTYFVFFRNHTPPATPPGGLAIFLSSGQFKPGSASAQGIADELQIDLQNIPVPDAGKSYYAWLLADKHPQAEAQPLQPPPQFTLPLKIGPLPFNQGHIRYLYPGTPQHDNLFSLASRLLITAEETNGTQRGPTADHSAWRYYAEVPQTPYGTPPLSALDHIRHLFYKETKVRVLGLAGGLDVWLFRNTEKVMEWAVSARDDYDTQGSGAGSMNALFVSMLDYLDGAPNVALDVPGGLIVVDPVIASVALLSVSPAQQNGSDKANNPPGYLDHVALHLNAVVRAPDATPQMRGLATEMVKALNNAKTWLQQVRSYAKQLVVMNAAQLSQPATLTMLDTMLQDATYAYIGQLDPKANQVVPGVLQVHYDVQKLAALTISAQLPQQL